MKNYKFYYSILLFCFYVSHTIAMNPHPSKSLRLRRSKKQSVIIQHEIQHDIQPFFPPVFNQKSSFENLAKYRFVFVNRLLTQKGYRPKNISALNKIQRILSEELLHINEHKLHANYQSEDLQIARCIVDLDKDRSDCTRFINNNELYDAEKVIQKNPYLVHYYFTEPYYQAHMGTMVHFVLNKATKEPKFRDDSCIMLRNLLKNGANPNDTDKEGNTPAHLASSIKQIEILLRWGAHTESKNKNDFTAFDKISFNMPECNLANYLEYTIVNFNIIDFDDFFKKLLLYKGSFIRKLLTLQGTTTDHYNALRKVQMVLQKGLLDSKPNTLEAQYDADTLHLIRCVIDLDKDCQAWKNYIEKNELYEAENLIEKNPYLVQHYFTDGNYQIRLGTMVHYILNKAWKEELFRNNSYLVLNSLLKNGANSNAVDKEGNTPMHLVSSIKQIEILLRWGGYSNQKNKALKTPLMKIYCESPHSPLLAFLLYAGINPNTQDVNGDTVLHLAVKSNDFGGCCTFLAHSASFIIPNAENKTAACYASDNPHIKKLMIPYMHIFLWKCIQKENFTAIEECILKYPWMSLEQEGKSLLELVEKSFNKKKVNAFKQILIKR